MKPWFAALSIGILAAGTLPAAADVIFLKDGSRYEGTLVPSEQPGMVVLVTPEVDRARGIDAKATGWKVDIKGDTVEITLPRDLVQESIDPSRDATSLIRALEHSDKRVRYAAAKALVGIRPKTSFIGADKVVRNLADAVGEAGIRVVLIASDDHDLSNRLRARVAAAQYIPVQAFNAVECLSSLKRSPTKDVIILDASLGREALKADRRAEDRKLMEQVDKITHYASGDKDIPVEKRLARELFLRLQEDYRAQAMPVIVLADEGAELELVQKIYAGHRVAAVLPKSVDEARLKSVLAGLFQRDDPSLRDSKDLADEASVSACQALASLDRQDPVFRPGDAEEALLKAVSESTEPRRVDAVRVAALKALGAVGTPAGYDEIVKILRNGANAPAVRSAAAGAVADIAKAAGVRCPDAVVAALQGALKDPEASVWSEAARGLGACGLDPAKIREILVQERLEKAVKE